MRILNILGSAFISPLDSIGLCQCVRKPTHCFDYTLDLVRFHIFLLAVTMHLSLALIHSLSLAFNPTQSRQMAARLEPGSALKFLLS